ncbi:MAG TPA: hypothetical protein VFA78_09455 [Chloroflexota bacterium]|nr:hypothetical protein [Chloroflexota bacterium]
MARPRDRSFQAVLLLTAEVESIGEEPDGVGPGPGSGAALQIADAPAAQARSLGQPLLRETGRGSVASQQRPEG